jgi:hypothetical protein
VLQRQQIAARSRAGHAGALAGLAGGQARVGVVEGFDDAHAALQAGDPVALVEPGRGAGKVGEIGAHGAGVCRAGGAAALSPHQD